MPKRLPFNPPYTCIPDKFWQWPNVGIRLPLFSYICKRCIDSTQKGMPWCRISYGAMAKAFNKKPKDFKSTIYRQIGWLVKNGLLEVKRKRNKITAYKINWNVKRPIFGKDPGSSSGTPSSINATPGRRTNGTPSSINGTPGVARMEPRASHEWPPNNKLLIKGHKKHLSKKSLSLINASPETADAVSNDATKARERETENNFSIIPKESKNNNNPEEDAGKGLRNVLDQIRQHFQFILEIKPPEGFEASVKEALDSGLSPSRVIAVVRDFCRNHSKSEKRHLVNLQYWQLVVAPRFVAEAPVGSVESIAEELGDMAWIMDIDAQNEDDLNRFFTSCSIKRCPIRYLRLWAKHSGLEPDPPLLVARLGAMLENWLGFGDPGPKRVIASKLWHYAVDEFESSRVLDADLLEAIGKRSPEAVRYHAKKTSGKKSEDDL